MEGVITISDSRENLERMKEWRRKEATKVINQNNTENIIDNVIDITKSVVSVAGAVATVVMTICPFDGPLGETATILATPALVQAVESSRNLLKGIFVNKDRTQITAAIADLKQNVQEISVIDKNLVKTTAKEPIKREVGNTMRM